MGRVGGEIKLDPHQNRTGSVWHVLLTQLDKDLLYGQGSPARSLTAEWLLHDLQCHAGYRVDGLHQDLLKEVPQALPAALPEEAQYSEEAQEQPEPRSLAPGQRYSSVRLQ